MTKLTIDQLRAKLTEKTGRTLPPSLDALLSMISSSGVEVDFEEILAGVGAKTASELPKPATFEEVGPLVRPMLLKAGDVVKWKPGFALDHDLMKEDTQAIVSSVFPPRFTDAGPMVEQATVTLAFMAECKSETCTEKQLIEVPFDGRRLMRVGDDD